MKHLKTLYTLLLLICTFQQMSAVPADARPTIITQPDGTTLTIILKGDEFFKYKTTIDGYLLVPDKEGVLTYAILDDAGNFISTRIKANDISKRSALEAEYIKKLAPYQPLIKHGLMRRKAKLGALKSSASVQTNFPLTGSPSSLVILVNFAGANEKFITADPQNAFAKLLNQVGYSDNNSTGSARDYFINNSNNAFSPTFDVVGPFTLANDINFYGQNDPNGDDLNPQLMVKEACQLAFNSGVNFAKYDVDNDGFVDNVFVYYAGHNEAENAPSNTIWPHRWTLGNYNTKFNGKIVYDYACTSELKGATGTNMCGIGTFCHEFGHVLGLPDYYATNNQNHQTLSYWNVMDAGPYLNGGKTPPAYSAYDRFFLNWMIPTELKSPTNISLDPLTTSNRAYIITQNGNHNLNGQNPFPTEFFTLENRQKMGWDAYLPGHGLLITRINYNANDWNDNSPNNLAAAMGVDIIEADKIASDATLSGDPFPGTSNVTSYSPVLRSGTTIYKEITNIFEKTGVITFDFMGGFRPPFNIAPLAYDATSVTTGSFACHWNTVPYATGFYLSTYSVSEGVSDLTEDFSNGLNAPIGWTIVASKVATSIQYSGKAVPAIQFTTANDRIITEKYILPVTNFSFCVRSCGAYNGNVAVEAFNGDSWVTIDNITVSRTLDAIKDYSFTTSKNYIQFKISYTNGEDGVAIDDVTASFDKKIAFVVRNKWLEGTTDTMINLIPNTDYFYKVRASDKTMNPNNTVKFEDITDFSNVIHVKTLEDKVGNVVRVKADGTIIALLPNTHSIIKIYNITGQLVKEIQPNSIISEISNLPKGAVYILHVGNNSFKFLIPL